MRRLIVAGVVVALFVSGFFLHRLFLSPPDKELAIRAALLKALDEANPVQLDNDDEVSERLTSQILPYYVSAIYRVMEPGPYKRVISEEELDDLPDSYLDDWALIDKVLVIPKVLHSLG